MNQKAFSVIIEVEDGVIQLEVIDSVVHKTVAALIGDIKTGGIWGDVYSLETDRIESEDSTDWLIAWVQELILEIQKSMNSRFQIVLPENQLVAKKLAETSYIDNTVMKNGKMLLICEAS